MAVGAESRIEVIRQSFASEISDTADTVEGKIVEMCAGGDSGGFHFDSGGASGAELCFFFGGADNVIDRTDGGL